MKIFNKNEVDEHLEKGGMIIFITDSGYIVDLGSKTKSGRLTCLGGHGGYEELTIMTPHDYALKYLIKKTDKDYA